MKIACAIPTSNGMISLQTMFSVVGLLSRHELTLLEQQGCYVHWNRHRLVQKAMAEGCDKLLFIDADMVFPPDTLSRLLAHDKLIIGAAYNERGADPAVSTVKIAGRDTFPSMTEIFPCDGLGTGVLLIDMSVFKATPQPWFSFEYHDDGTLKVGEDMWFCQRARAAGFTVWCDPTIPVGHLGVKIF